MSQDNAERSERARRLLEAGRGGDPAALGELLNLYRDYLLAIAQKEIPGELQPKLGASDVVQNTFLEAYRIFAEFQGGQPDEFRAWLRQVLVFKLHEAENHYRGVQKRQVGREQSLDDSGDGRVLRQHLPGSDSTPSGNAARREEALTLDIALKRLPEQYQQVVTWRTWDGLSFAVIGVRLQRSEEAARKLYARAMLRLQEEMAGTHAEPAERPKP